MAVKGNRPHYSKYSRRITVENTYPLAIHPSCTAIDEFAPSSALMRAHLIETLPSKDGLFRSDEIAGTLFLKQITRN